MSTDSKHSFFKQSGWLLIAANTGNGLMWLVHLVARRMEPDQYSLMTTMFQSLLMLGAVSAAIQLVVAQQTATALDKFARDKLAFAARKITGALLGLWLIGAFVTYLLSNRILSNLHIDNPMVLWLTLAFALVQLMNPIPCGVLQGRENFFWLGCTFIIHGAGRYVPIFLLVFLMGGQAASGIAGAVIGLALATGVAAWHCRDIWSGPHTDFDWKSWLRWAVPLTLGFGATTFVLTADIIHVRRSFSGESSAFYNTAGMVGRALAILTVPLTAVMFPKVAAAAARAEKTNAMVQALGATALLGICTAIGCSLLPELPIRLIQGEKYLPAAKLIPAFAWCILPVTLATVLVNNLLAARRFAIVPWLMITAVAYTVALNYLGTTPAQVVYTLGGAGLVLLAVAAWFTWAKRPASAASGSAT
jgi:O-antigen/teichoic acid export membrane protein